MLQQLMRINASTLTSFDFVENPQYEKVRTIGIEPHTSKWIARNLTTTTISYLGYQMKYIIYVSILHFNLRRE